MKFVSMQAHNNCTPYQNYMTYSNSQYISTFIK